MGSLPGPGWAETFTGSSSSPTYPRSMSATRQEIDAFHRELHRKSLEGQSAEQDAQEAMRRSQTMSPRQSDSPRSILDGGVLDSDENQEITVARKAWWRRSNWAFLNDPPEMDVKDGAKGYSYVTQHKLAARTIRENAF
eukprot:TRINITY_DN18455_c0_g1_i1.p2 TRINITY_DN18455_c0_g1~~TRINITY_DN18455_c0_g1_i1.p2  ORF type:complete len:139 (-),score=16.21 TRINITY_DN18455_c0_g1_i1:513-929(-)